jgi:hypothetical protein
MTWYDTISGNDGHHEATILQDSFKGLVVDVLVLHLLPPLCAEEL